MLFKICLYSSLIIFILGIFYKVSTWFRGSINIEAKGFTAWHRFITAARGITKTLLSPKLFTIIKVLIIDVILQIRILKQDFLRWIMHMLIYGGFVFLLLMHALDKIITINIFPEYYSTINPFLFLRNFAGVLVLLGVAIALYRRFFKKARYISTNAMDNYAIIIVALIIISGFLLEGVKMASYSKYRNMVDEYAGIEDEEELMALETFWVREYGVVSPNISPPFDQVLLEQGKALHEISCASCHSIHKSAFVGYSVAKLTRPVALIFDGINFPTILLYIHFLACFLGLAYLPFSKMFHILASPLCLLVNAVMDQRNPVPANVATRQIMELDACTHCSTCSQHCSAAVAYEVMDNINILPSEKMISLKALVAKKKLSEMDIRSIQEGIYLCTNCDRCTVVCPVGINLRELWFNVREYLIQEGVPEPLVLSPLSYYRGLNKDKLNSDYEKPIQAIRKSISVNYESMQKDEVLFIKTDKGNHIKDMAQSSQINTYLYCFSCENCTTVCPVVQNYDNPQEVLGLLPHQIMRSAGLGLNELAFGSRMLWDCLTCYQCQEHCPQGVYVSDVLYDLRNAAIKSVKQQY